MTQHIHEGTAQELAPYLAQRPKAQFRLTELETDEEPTVEAALLPNPKNAASIALLKSWIAQAPTGPEEIRQAEEELREFKRNMNANRAATGERIPYPDLAVGAGTQCRDAYRRSERA